MKRMAILFLALLLAFTLTSVGQAAGTKPVPAKPAPTGTLVVAPKELEFGTTRVGQTRKRTLTIKNEGSGVLTGSVGTLAAPFGVVTGGGSFSLKKGQRKLVTVSFKPSAKGKANATLAITSNDPKRSSVSVSVRGTGK